MLYVIVKSERTSKGQGGNEYVNIEVHRFRPSPHFQVHAHQGNEPDLLGWDC
jgi:hypothetical protein